MVQRNAPSEIFVTAPFVCAYTYIVTYIIKNEKNMIAGTRYILWLEEMSPLA